jgi:hypothetical protein
MRWREGGVSYSVPIEFLVNSPARVGIYSGETADSAPAPVDGRFCMGNPYCWKPGHSGNPRGRRRVSLENDLDFRGRMVDLIAQVHEMRRRLPLKRDSRFERFRVLYELTGNAFKSARIAGYGWKTARSKGYLLARRARQSAGMG